MFVSFRSFPSSLRDSILGSESLTTESLPGCLDALVFYKGMLRNLLSSSVYQGSEHIEVLRLDEERVEMLRKLEAVDPMRRERYRDLSEFLRIHSLES